MLLLIMYVICCINYTATVKTNLTLQLSKFKVSVVQIRVSKCEFLSLRQSCHSEAQNYGCNIFL